MPRSNRSQRPAASGLVATVCSLVLMGCQHRQAPKDESGDSRGDAELIGSPDPSGAPSIPAPASDSGADDDIAIIESDLQWLEQAVTELSADASELSQEYALLLIAYAHAKLSDLGIPAERYSVVLGEDQAGNARVEVAVPGSEVDRVASEFASAPQQSGLLQVLRKVDRGPAALDIMYSYQFKPSLLDGDVIQTGRVWAELTRALQNGCGAELDSDSEVGSSTALRVNTHWNYYDRGGKVGFLFKARFVLGYTDSANDGEPAGEYGQISLEQELLVRRRSASQWRRVPVEDLSTIGSSTSPATRCLDVISTSVRDQG